MPRFSRLPLGRSVRRLLVPMRWVSARGWLVLTAGAAALAVQLVTGWRELAYAGTALVLLFALCSLLALGRGGAAADLQLPRRRVVAGTPATALVGVTNLGRHRLSATVDLAVGGDPGPAASRTRPTVYPHVVRRVTRRFRVPGLGPDQRRELELTVATTLRGVIPVGPAEVVRGDPLGLVRRVLARTAPTELIVHPPTTPLEPLGSGMLRDLEGRTTNDVSTSDLAFHTLRPYLPGDDVRHIHWPSSEKLAGSRDSAPDAVGADSDLLVRQFLDTRRTHLAVVLDSASTSFATEAEFELAVSVAASVAGRAAADGLDLTVVSGASRTVRPAPVGALDLFARLAAGRTPMAQATQGLLASVPGVSAAVLVTGSALAPADVMRATLPLVHRVPSVVIRVVLDVAPDIRQLDRLPVLTVGSLADLRSGLQRAPVR